MITPIQITQTNKGLINEYEGHITFVTHNKELLGRAILNPEEWAAIKVMKTYEVALEFLRYGKYCIDSDKTTRRYTYLSGINYQIEGIITSVRESTLFVNCGFSIEVDLDLSAAENFTYSNHLLGKHISIEGCFEIDFDI